MTHHTLKPQIDELRADYARLGQRIKSLESLCRSSAGQTTPMDIIAKNVCEVFGVELLPLLWKRRGSRAMCEARQAAMAIMYQTIEGATMEEVSAYFGRTHGTVDNAIERTENLRATDPEFRRKFERVRERVKTGI